MSDVNSYNLSGRLTRDANLRYLQSGTALAEFTVASNRIWKSNGEKKEDTLFIDVNVWGKQAEFIGGLKKGDYVMVTGRIRQESWEVEGQKRSKYVVIADQVNLPPGQVVSSQPKASQKAEEEVNFEEEVPF